MTNIVYSCRQLTALIAKFVMSETSESAATVSVGEIKAKGDFEFEDKVRQILRIIAIMIWLRL